MFNKNDPLIGSVKQVMAENQVRRDVEKQLNEELGIHSKKALPFEHHAEYNALLEQRIAEALHPNQQKLDVHEPEKDELTKQDFVKLRAMKKKTVKEEEGEETREGGAVTRNGKPVVSPTATRAGESSARRPASEGPSASERQALTNMIKKDVVKEEQLEETSEAKRKEYKEKAGRSVAAAVLKTGLRRMVGMKSPSDKDSETIRKRVQGLTRQARASKSPEDASDAAAMRYNLGVSEPRRGKGKLKEEKTFWQKVDDVPDHYLSGSIGGAIGIAKEVRKAYRNFDSKDYERKPDDTMGAGNKLQRQNPVNRTQTDTAGSGISKSTPTPSTPPASNTLRMAPGAMTGGSFKPEAPSTGGAGNKTAPSLANPNTREGEYAINRSSRSIDEDSEQHLEEKAVSKAQQRFFGLVRGIQKGEAKGSEKAEKAAKEMSTKEVRKYAKTKQKGLPEKVDEDFDIDAVMEEIARNLGEEKMKKVMEQDQPPAVGTFRPLNIPKNMPSDEDIRKSTEELKRSTSDPAGFQQQQRLRSGMSQIAEEKTNKISLESAIKKVLKG